VICPRCIEGLETVVIGDMEIARACWHCGGTGRVPCGGTDCGDDDCLDCQPSQRPAWPEDQDEPVAVGGDRPTRQAAAPAA